MHIADDHLFYGSALTQIAEHRKFTAINVVKMKNKPMRNAYKINKNIAVYLKHAAKPNGTFDEYKFIFSLDHQKELKSLQGRFQQVFITLICIEDRQICLLPYDHFIKIQESRKLALGSKEDNFTILVTCKKGKSFRVYANEPGTKGRVVGRKTINRNDFPKNLFE